MSHAAYVRILCNLVGPSIARVIDEMDGWPGLIELQLSTGPVRISLHVGQVHSMKRKPHEFRFQNPAQSHPVRILQGTTPLLIGVWDTDRPNVLVAAQPEIRLGDLTRFSVLFPDRLFRNAQQVGWAEPFRNKKGGMHWSFLPALLPTFAESYQDEIDLVPKDVQIAVAGAGLTDQPGDASAGRARQAATRLFSCGHVEKVKLDDPGVVFAVLGFQVLDDPVLN